jgi:outer membrane protein TolC
VDDDLAALIRIAARRNPRLAAARSRWLAARERPAQARALPDPMLTYTEQFEPIQTRVGPLERSVMLTQPIPFPGRLSAAGLVASEQARVKELDYHIALRDIVAEVKVTHAELVYLHRAIEIVEQNQ